MDEGINYECDYLDLDSCSCWYLDEMKRMPSLGSDCSCLDCIIALHRAKECRMGNQATPRRGKWKLSGMDPPASEEKSR